MSRQLGISDVGMLKGAKLSILVLLTLEPDGGNQEWLERYAGYTDKPVSQALLWLVEQGWIEKRGRRGHEVYRLTGAVQLPLVGGVLDTTRLAAAPAGVTNEIESESFRLALEESSSSRTFSTDEGLLLEPVESENFRLKFEACEAGGIREPARTRIARNALLWVELIEYHCRTAPNAAMAIFRIEHRWPILEEVENRRKYVEGAYADFIEH